MTIYYSAHARYSALPPEPAGFRILHVCVANQCRSPMAERITRHELTRRLGDERAGWESASAGTKASDGTPMHKYSLRALQALGVDGADFRSRQLTPAIAVEADLILAATAVERDLVIAKVPATLPTAFTLREFARLVAAVPATAQLTASGPEGLARAVVAEARKLRGRVPFVDPAADDLPDPARTAAAFEKCAADIASAVSTVLGRLLSTQVTAGTP